MRKIMLALAVILTVGLTSAFANNSEDINRIAIASFKNDFSQATQVSWQEGKDYVKATFTLNDQVMFAYYSKESNELMAVERNILTDQLPINLYTSLKKDYRSEWISGLFEMAKPDHTVYFATLENADERIVLKSNGSSEWVMYKREKK